MKTTIPTFILLLVLTGCDPARFADLQIPVSTGNDISFSTATSYSNITHTITEIAIKHNLTYEHDQSDVLESDASLFFHRDRFSILVLPPDSNNFCRIRLSDFPSYNRSKLSKEIEADLIEKFPDLTKTE